MSDETIPAGIYTARGVAGSVQYGKTKNGNNQIAINLHVPVLNRQLTTFLYFSEKSEKYSIDRLHALGWEGEIPIANIDRNEVQVEVSYEEYQGEQKMRVQILTGGGTVTIEPMAAQEQKAFLARLQHVAGGSRPRNAAASPETPPTEGGFEL